MELLSSHHSEQRWLQNSSETYVTDPPHGVYLHFKATGSSDKIDHIILNQTPQTHRIWCRRVFQTLQTPWTPHRHRQRAQAETTAPSIGRLRQLHHEDTSSPRASAHRTPSCYECCSLCSVSSVVMVCSSCSHLHFHQFIVTVVVVIVVAHVTVNVFGTVCIFSFAYGPAGFTALCTKSGEKYNRHLEGCKTSHWQRWG